MLGIQSVESEIQALRNWDAPIRYFDNESIETKIEHVSTSHSLPFSIKGDIRVILARMMIKSFQINNKCDNAFS